MAILPGFVGPAYRTQSLIASVDECVNLYLEAQVVAKQSDQFFIQQPSSTPRQVYYGRPGLTSAFTIQAPVRGQFAQDGRSFAAGGGEFYETTGGVAVAKGAIPDDLTHTPVTIVSNGGRGHQVLVVASGFGYIFDLTAGTFTQIADANFPQGSAVMADFQDGYFLVCTASTMYLSALFDGTSWPALAVAQRSIQVDDIAAVLFNHRELWVVGTRTSEAWEDVGATGFAYAPISGVFLQQGTPAPRTVCRLDNSVVWLAQNADGDRQVILVSDFNPARISTHAVEYRLRQCATVSDFIGWVYQEEGHLFYVLSSLANQLTWVYDASERQWLTWSYRNPNTGLDEAYLGRNHCQVNGVHYVGDRQSGIVYQQALGLYDDNGAAIRALRRAPHLNNENKRLVVDRFALEGEVGVGTQAGQGLDPQIMFRMSGDGGQTWGPLRTRSWGKAGQYWTRTFWPHCGGGRNLVFEVSMTDPVKRCWTQADVLVRPCAW